MSPRLRVVLIAVAAAAVLGATALGLALLGPDQRKVLESGIYKTFEDAEAAVGFAIPRPRELGQLKLEEVHVSASAEDTFVERPERGRSGNEWYILAMYTGPGGAAAGFFFTEEKLPDTPGAEVVDVNGAKGSLVVASRPRTAFINWNDEYGFHAVATLNDGPPGQAGLSMDEFLTFVRSIR